MNKMSAYRGKTTAEIIELNPPPISTETFNRYVERISGLFKFAISKRKYALRYNPFSGRGLDDSKTKKREPFTVEELTKIFGAAEHAQRKHKSTYAYWLPIMGLFAGARPNELCQRHLSDFEVTDGVRYINIRDEEDFQRVKNNNVCRQVPVHEKLIEVGLIRYVERLRDQGQQRLLPMLKFYEKDGDAKKPSDWFGQFGKRCGIMETHTKAFHSFRHTFISSLLNDGVPELSIAQIVGMRDGRLRQTSTGT
ncbi:site-specific integrase [Massilia rhizosphaerae]|uniref:site-specific integrase n=1 Tax=Massilia rhizosphaerae TaxID=2784389 RepID=UPI0018DAFB65|nr:site-specific integrase [Massilia rhizosphaerae]